MTIPVTCPSVLFSRASVTSLHGNLKSIKSSSSCRPSSVRPRTQCQLMQQQSENAGQVVRGEDETTLPASLSTGSNAVVLLRGPADGLFGAVPFGGLVVESTSPAPRLLTSSTSAGLVAAASSFNSSSFSSSFPRKRLAACRIRRADRSFLKQKNGYRKN
jgi:hypothetical protein